MKYWTHEIDTTQTKLTKYCKGIENMTTIQEEAKAYVPQETKNITELGKVAVQTEITEATYTDKEGKEFTVKEIEVMGEKYRVPVSVLKQLKSQLEERPDAEFFKVKKSGSGLQTEYTVILVE